MAVTVYCHPSSKRNRKDRTMSTALVNDLTASFAPEAVGRSRMELVIMYWRAGRSTPEAERMADAALDHACKWHQGVA